MQVKPMTKDYLGFPFLWTSYPYAKVDVNLLKEVAQPWPGVRPC